MKDLRLQPQKSKFSKIKLFFKKKWKTLLILFFILILILFPVESATIIGIWCHKFIFTFLKYFQF